jgi:hypothetical protein
MVGRRAGLAAAAATAAVLLAGCAPSPAPAPPPAQREPVKAPDLTAEPWYPRTAAELTELHGRAEALFKAGKPDAAAKLLDQAQPMMKRLLDTRQPTIEAMMACSDFDDLYGRMLMANRQYGWARTLFQKNVARWKNWRPSTEDTARRLKLANQAIAECDRRMAE